MNDMGMNALFAIIAKLGLELHPDRIESIAESIEILGEKDNLASRGINFGPNMDKELLRKFEEAWKTNETILPRDVAFALRGASASGKIGESRGAAELAWTGPNTGQVPIRNTEQALCEVVDSAKSRLFLVSFVAYRVPTLERSLTEAVRRQVEISILLESSDEHGGSLSHDSVKAMRYAMPSVDFYEWSHDPAADEDRSAGKVHAKCAVADEQLAFITSANLTSAAMERNMELGVIVRGGELPSMLHRHLEALIETGVIAKIDF
jgi:phosphatidylserine/phosphatidylglycerophosphate/cardiolipin synthase-like enzyme